MNSILTAKRSSGWLVLWLFGLCVLSTAERLPRAEPKTVGMSSAHLELIDSLVAEGIKDGKMPGCVVAAGHKGKLVFLKAYGNRSLFPIPVPMKIDTVFDMASITKPVVTATSIMVLLEQGKIRLRDRVSKLIPEFGVNGKQDITVEQLLTHQGGLIPDNALKDYLDGKEEAMKRIYSLPTYVEPGSKFVYTDVGFILLADIVERLSGEHIHDFSQRYIFRPLGMEETGYNPINGLQIRAAVTEKRNGSWIEGEVHDPRAYALDGIAGHAGLFSTAEDMAVYAQMMLQRGSYNGKQILNPQTARLMTTDYPVSSGIRGLGWDKRTGFSSNRGEVLTDLAFGHGGFTGTVLWIDPGLDLFYLFLSNRVHPDGKGSVNHLAGRIGTVIASSIRSGHETLQPEVRDAEDSPIQELGFDCLTGLDVLQRGGFELLRGKRVGLITNHTALDREVDWIVPILHEAIKVDLSALFSPEHGLRGRLDIPEIADEQESQTGLKIYSLYGENRKPSADQLKDLDCLVFDIQDIGTRFYTYISTMGLAMQAANEEGMEFIVLDRPNPIGGDVVAGPMIDDDKLSFVGFHSLPVRHGMTVGELSQMFAAELGLSKLKLRVVEVENWDRKQTLDQTGLLWTNPSPNMRNLNQALLYPGIGLLETTNVSVGRGTDTPFEIIGAPWIDAIKLSKSLNRMKLPGVTFVPRRFVPESSKFANESCEGVNVLITDRNVFEPIKTGLAIATTLRTEYSDSWEVDRYLRLLGNQQVFEAVKKGDSLDEIMLKSRASLNAFRVRREPFLLY
ncbi:MAG: exo-beta-N-acetylmuramidase NamZ domain-containing protein [Planctomycetota bacterium]